MATRDIPKTQNEKPMKTTSSRLVLSTLPSGQINETMQLSESEISDEPSRPPTCTCFCPLTLIAETTCGLLFLYTTFGSYKLELWIACGGLLHTFLWVWTSPDCEEAIAAMTSVGIACTVAVFVTVAVTEGAELGVLKPSSATCSALESCARLEMVTATVLVEVEVVASGEEELDDELGIEVDVAVDEATGREEGIGLEA